MICDLTTFEYEQAKLLNPGEDCPETWKLYIRESKRDVAVQLRKWLKPSEDKACGYAFCDSGFKCNKHAHNDPETVQVLSQLRGGTKDSIREILEREKPKFLLTTTEMKFINIFAKILGDTPFPFYTFVKNKKKYAVPQIPSSNDMKTCPAHFCK